MATDDGSAPFQRGCLNPLTQIIEYVINLIASGTTIIVIFQVICIVSAVVFIIQLRNYKRQLALRNPSSTGGLIMHTLPPITEEKVRF